MSKGNAWNCWPCWPRICHCGNPRPLPVVVPGMSKNSRQRRQKPGRDIPFPGQEQ
ncbi:hypothetical protein ABRZ04_04275 [Castellaniella ginsengisoli]|uniref:Uncharacterized protein n=1 Tax=Castellaniella ginsengisoli TaxID=546114 RepID=A0AB39D2E8_9BURK